jgi:uncharacterized protein (TIRG00374 family)
MKPKTKSIIQFVILLGIGILLVWLAFSQVAEKKDEIVNAFTNANYFWVMISVIIGFISHFLRAYRWNYLLEPLGHKTTLLNANAAVFIGYFANYGLPRMGEISRCTVAGKYDKIPFQIGFGTVVTERIIDTFLLLIIFLLTLVFQFAELGGLMEKYIFSGMRSKSHALAERPILAIALVIFIGGTTLALFVLRKKIMSKLKGKFGSVIKGFIEGLSSVKRIKNLGAFVGLSFLIWMAYFYSLYFCLKALPETAVINQTQCLTLMLFGTLGIVFTPGGLGAYHIIIAEILMFYSVDQVPAVAFPWLVWTSQFILIAVLGLISMAALPIINKKNHVAS